MNICKIAVLAAGSIVTLIEPVFAATPTPGPVAGVGLSAIAIVGGACWVGAKLFRRKS